MESAWRVRCDEIRLLSCLLFFGGPVRLKEKLDALRWICRILACC